MTPRRRQLCQLWWTSCCLVSALTAGVSVACAAEQIYHPPSSATAFAQPATPAELRSGAAAAPATTAPDYERLSFMAQTSNETEEERGSAAGLLVRTAGALLLIVGLLAAAAWGLRRFGGAQFSGPSEDAPELAVLATISLGERRSLSAVRFGERLLLIGSTAQAITLLAAKARPPRNVTPRMRSVADLLREDEPQSFEHALTLADERLEQQAGTPASNKDSDKETV